VGGRVPVAYSGDVSERFSSVRLSEIEPITVADGLAWLPVRRTLGVEAFGINAYVAANAGEPVVEEHTEESLGHEEVYVVLSGRATFSLDGETLDAPSGTAVFVREPTVRRGAVAAEPDTKVLAIGGKVGEPYSPSAWEWYFAAERHRQSADYDQAVTLMADGLERFPDHAGMLYAAACWESLAGLANQAIEHLRRAVALEPRYAEWSKTDADLDAIRSLPGYPV
jgi:mannose-6-phosphate isomerase-like protein (cupin superfamily)